MATLVRRGRHRLIPALVLLHPDERVVRQALDMFATEPRTDWFTLGNRLLRHSSETLRLAAARALAAHGELDARKLSSDSTPSVRGYATVFELLDRKSGAALDGGRIAELARGSDLGRLGMLAAIADAEPSESASLLLLALADSPPVTSSPSWTELLARATVKLHEPRMIPRLLLLLAHRQDRQSIMSALVSLGDPACTALAAALKDPSVDRQIRIHLPATLAGFGTKGSSEALLDCIEHDTDGRVRYKAIRALETIVANPNVRADRIRVEFLVRKNLTEYFRLLGTRVALAASHAPVSSAASQYRLLLGLLDDKLRQSLERAWRLLRIAHPRDDIRSAYVAFLSKDKTSRANAAEYLDALLRNKDQQTLRELVRLATDELSAADQVARAQLSLRFRAPRTREEAVRAAIADPDMTLATIAALYAVESEDAALVESVFNEQRRRPALATIARSIFQKALPLGQVAHA
jgi:hypothetical protein